MAHFIAPYDSSLFTPVSLLNTDPLLLKIREGRKITRGEQLRLTAGLALPAIVAQVAGVLLQYIDAAMVGQLGANPSASIGLVSTTCWLFGGIGGAIGTGFSVQVAHRVGANDMQGARDVLRHCFFIGGGMGLLLGLVGVLIAWPLPVWLGGGEEILRDASVYFGIFAASIPILQISYSGMGSIRASGNIRFPSTMGVVMCLLDVVFNFLFIFPSRTCHFAGLSVPVWGAGLGVTGAALGTMTAETLTALVVWYYIIRRSPVFSTGEGPLLSFRRFKVSRGILKRALAISSPIGLERVVTTSAQIVTTMILAPLGAASIAAHSFGITVEALCYMPGYGIQEAATTLVGQSIGARRYELTKRFAWLCVGLGMAVMSVMGAVMWVGAPVMMAFITPVQEIIALGTSALRIEAWAEPMFAASIVCYGCMVGAGDTLKPASINFLSMWLVRISLALLFVRVFGWGLNGVWLAMCIELCVRGAVFLCRLRWGGWLKQR